MSRGPRFSKRWAHEWMARGRQIEGMNPNEELTEAELHDLVRRECDRRGWIALHGDMSRPTGRTPGEPDFIILADKGRVFLVECKTEDGQLSADQFALRVRAAELGHTVTIVRSLEAFLLLTK